MAQKFYVVWKGRQTGIFTDWNTCKQQVDAFAGAKYKSFKTRAEAEAAFSGTALTNSSGTPNKSSKKPSSRQTIKTYTASEITELSNDVKIFTDGGCEPNPGNAGSGIAIYRNNKVSELWYGLYNPNGTNNTAELHALHQALLMAQNELNNGQSVAILCDSKYSIQCVTQWAINWQQKGWKKPSGEIKNLKLIKEMFALHQQIKDKIKVLHVNGHVGVEGNELADRMSIVAIEEKELSFIQYDNALDINQLLALRSG